MQESGAGLLKPLLMISVVRHHTDVFDSNILKFATFGIGPLGVFRA